jgi:hypothetical protein
MNSLKARHKGVSESVSIRVQYNLAAVALIFAFGAWPTLLSCRPESDYSKVTRIEFSRRGLTQPLTKSDGVTVASGCEFNADSTPNDAKLWGVSCRRKADGSLTGGGYVFDAPTKAPAEIFKSLAVVLRNANALDLNVPASASEGYAADTDNYLITIDSGGTARKFAVDASASRRLSPAESAIINLFTQLQTVMEGQMTPCCAV